MGKLLTAQECRSIPLLLQQKKLNNMSTKPVWTVSDTTDAKHLGTLSVEGKNGEEHDFEILFKNNKLIFGGACNVGFLESGYMEFEEGETEPRALIELNEELEVYYRAGYDYTNRIVCNDRM
jgi:hypothetical protein